MSSEPTASAPDAELRNARCPRDGECQLIPEALQLMGAGRGRPGIPSRAPRRASTQAQAEGPCPEKVLGSSTVHQSCASLAQVPGTGASCGDEAGLHPAAGVLEEEETQEADSCVTTEQRSGSPGRPGSRQRREGPP